MSSNRATSIVVDFSEKAFDDGRPEEAAAEALGGQYVQHNPGAQDGPEGFGIVGHWDVVQEVPEESSNDNTMF